MLEEAAIQLTEASDDYAPLLGKGTDLDFVAVWLEQRIAKQQISLARNITSAGTAAALSVALEEQQLDQADSLETLTLAVNKHHQQAGSGASAASTASGLRRRELGRLITEVCDPLSIPLHGLFYYRREADEASSERRRSRGV